MFASAGLVAVTLTTSLSLTACSLTPSQTVQEVNKSVTTDASSFTVAIRAGRLVVVAGVPGMVSLRGTVTYKGAQAPMLLWQSSGTSLALRSVCHSVHNDCSYEYTLALPSVMGIAASNAAGDVSVADLNGPVQVSASAGNVSLAGLSGRVTLTDNAGNVTAQAIKGDVADVTIGAGNATLGYVTPPSHLFVQDSTGNIAATVPNSSSYHVVTNIRTGSSLNDVPDDPSSLNTISLSVEVGNVSLHY